MKFSILQFLLMISALSAISLNMSQNTCNNLRIVNLIHVIIYYIYQNTKEAAALTLLFFSCASESAKFIFNSVFLCCFNCIIKFILSYYF